MVKKLITDRNFWLDMRKYINSWSSQFIRCQKSKTSRDTKTPAHKLEIPKGRFQHILIEKVDTLRQPNGNHYILTIIDRRPRWFLQGILQTIIAKTFITNCISHFGIPRSITNYQSAQFPSSLFTKLTKLRGIHKVTI